mgnify:CR=1 FL=1
MESLQKIEKQLAESGTQFIDSDTPSTADSKAFADIAAAKVEPTPQKVP